MTLREGTWLQPRHGSKEVFEKDYPAIASDALTVICPGCRDAVALARRSPTGRMGGWCRRCNRGVGS